jgi:hypothetical protein
LRDRGEDMWTAIYKAREVFVMRTDLERANRQLEIAGKSE